MTGESSALPFPVPMESKPGAARIGSGVLGTSGVTPPLRDPVRTIQLREPLDYVRLGAGFDLVRTPVPRPPETSGSQSQSLGAYSPPSTEPIFTSGAAEQFARQHGLVGSLVSLRTHVRKRMDVVEGLRIDLASDPEVRDWFTICFCVQTTAPIDRVLEFDEDLRGMMYDHIPPEHHVYFALRFEFT